MLEALFVCIKVRTLEQGSIVELSKVGANTDGTKIIGHLKDGSGWVVVEQLAIGKKQLHPFDVTTTHKKTNIFSGPRFSKRQKNIHNFFPWYF